VKDYESLLERVIAASHTLPDGRKVLPLKCWKGMGIHTPKVYDVRYLRTILEATGKIGRNHAKDFL
jgi:hypothetical protein